MIECAIKSNDALKVISFHVLWKKKLWIIIYIISRMFHKIVTVYDMQSKIVLFT